MTDLAREYGEGLYLLAKEENISAEVMDQLEMLAHSFRDNPEYVSLLSNMALPVSERKSVIDSVFQGQVHPYVVNFLKILCERGALGEFRGCVTSYKSQFNSDNGIVEAVVTTSSPMTDAQRSSLISKLTEMEGAKVHLTEKIDSSIMDGIVLEMNGRRYENTVAERLRSIHRVMNGKE